MSTNNNCWANIDKTEGSLNSKLNVYFDENETGASRMVKIRVSSAEGDVSEEYTLVQKKKDQVVYSNSRQSETFTKEGCNPTTEKGEELEYVVEAGKYTSLISQADADRKAMEDIERNGQKWVNENGKCITILWYNVKTSRQFRKNDCDPDTEEGSLVTMTVEAGQFSSTISQADADSKAEAELDAHGQEYANAHGTCTTVKWYNDRMAKSFQKSDCAVTEVGTMVEYVVEANRFSSTVSKEDANRQATEALNAEGPAYANEHGTCTTNLWYNTEKSKTFYKNDCGAGLVGDEYVYTVEAGKYTSDISQEDADQKALDDIETNGQAQANLNGECIPDPNYYVGRASARVQKNDCNAVSQTGSYVDLTEKDLAGYPDAFVSTESQEAANALAEAAMEEQKQGLANQKGTCIDKEQFVGVYSETFTKDNCTDGGVGSSVVVDQDDVTGGPFVSYESQEAANALAEAAVKAQGQKIANDGGNCTWTGHYSASFAKNDCPEGQTGSVTTVTEQDVVGGPFTSTVSQADADSKAETAVKAQGQAIANNRGNCENLTVYTGHYSKNFTPECESCHEGVEMEVTAEMVNGSPVTSTVSQEAADAEAQRVVEAGGQAYANKNGDCNPSSTEAVWEDVTPEELRCNEGVSQKKQHDTNECSPSYNEERWVNGGNKVCQWTGHYTETFQKNDCEIQDSGTEVEVSEADVEGAPFISYVSQADADSKAEAAVKAQGQAIANRDGRCRFVGVYSEEFAKDNCGSCQHGIPMTVTPDMVGGPFYSDESQEAANALAEAAVKSQGQAYANKNGLCETDSTDPVWVDSDPLETKCENGVSYKKQVNTNECYGGDDVRWIEGGGKVCSWTGSYSKEFTKECSGTGVGSKVTVDQDDVTGGPFTSTVSQEDANNKAKAAVEAQGQAIANSTGTCTWTGKASKTFTRDNCGTCQHGSTVTVTQDQVGGPFTSTVSQADADSKALAAVNAQGQAVANKNGDCLADSTTPSWNDTGNTRCNGCSSEKEQKDTNACSSTYNNTKWVSGGGRSCSNWVYYSSGDCVGHTQYNAYREECSGTVDKQYSVNCTNCCNCGIHMPTTEYRCSGTTREVKTVDSCGNVRWDTYETNSLSCGGCNCSLTVNDISFSSSSGTKKSNVSSVCTGASSSENISYTASSNQSWCTVQVVSGGVNVTCTANGSHSGRSATVTVTQSGKCSQSKSFTVSQEGKPNDYVFTLADGSTSKTYNATASGGTIQYTVTSTKNGSSIGFSSSGATAMLSPTISGNTVTIVIAPNNTSSTKSGTVTLTQSESGKTITISISQAKKQDLCYFTPTGTVSVMSHSGSQTTFDITLSIAKTGNPVPNSVKWEILCGSSTAASNTVPTSQFDSSGRYSFTETAYTGSCSNTSNYTIRTSMVQGGYDCQ